VSLHQGHLSPSALTQKIYFSQSTTFGSITVWIPLLYNTSVTYEVWESMQSHTSQSIQVVENLTMQQKRAFGEENLVPHAFFPHIGLFAKDFVMGVVLLKK
jgi:hypothetical protein